MPKERVSVKVIPKEGSEEAYFREQDQKKIKNLREKTAQQATAKYCEEHKGHCFRCGTPSLVEVDRGGVKLDICVNENCGAVHLDPGELEQILKNRGVISSIRECVFGVFSK
jgi:hypothetical protein